MKVKELYWDEIEEQAQKYAWQNEPVFITEEEEEEARNDEPFFGDNEPAF